MTLPAALRSRIRTSTEHHDTEQHHSSSESSPTTKEQPSPPPGLDDASIKRATRLRRGFAFSACFAYLVSWIFLVLVLIGNTYNRPVLSSIYFYKLNLADIIPTSVPNASLINSIAQSIGLHDFYQVGLWNFCEGYLGGVGITYCSPPTTLYWFNPVEVLMNELLSGATIALPTQVVTILSVLRITSQIMFGFFLTAAVLGFLLAFLSPLAVRSRWWSLPLAVASFLEMMLVLAASIVGTAISFAFKYAAEAQSELNIHAEVGVKMFVFMWIATGFSIWGFAVHSGMGCCCTSRRDLRIGRRVMREGRVERQPE
ncbi:SUR7/PalI family-domain-containing protein [Achaetomium macrosporum]|uniref:SUR7/PalI family-domain-containing protein n=1 Tax=Achaetomium macrosporum TaxID=79813 RepID=A0AAN7C759_9PEZI|nr:SUR7/PalI family-domain-containing protein [Achaetomium macrosporum]